MSQAQLGQRLGVAEQRARDFLGAELAETNQGQKAKILWGHGSSMASATVPE